MALSHLPTVRFKMLFNLLNAQQVRVLMVQIKQIHFMGEKAAVETAFLDDHDMEPARVGVNRRSAHAPRCALATNYHGSDAELSQVRLEGRSKESARSLFGDYHIVRFGLELRFYGIGFGIVARRPSLSSIEAFRPTIRPDVHR